MNWSQHKKKTLASLALGFVVMTGTYNAIVINSESELSNYDAKLVKRLDEVYGIVKPGRGAASISWQKLEKVQAPSIQRIPPPQFQKRSFSNNQVAENSTVTKSVPVAAVQDELSLHLVEVANTKKWEKGLTSTQFSGNLSTNNGVIETLSVALPNGEGVSVSFSEMTGNVFEYDLNGEVYSGMMYQVDQTSYMVTLTNGPLEGTRMRFASEAPAQTEEPAAAAPELAENQTENQNIEVGNFGEEQAAPQAEVALENPEAQEAAEKDLEMQAQGFNFSQQEAM